MINKYKKITHKKWIKEQQETRTRGYKQGGIYMWYSIITLLLLAFCGVGTSNSWAAPTINSVSGNINHKQIITIVGSGYGVKSPAAPLLWDTFEQGTNGGALSADPHWVKYNGPGSTTGGYFNNTESYSGTLSAYNRTTGPSASNPVNLHFNTSNFFFKPTDKIYYSYMSKYIVTGDSYGVLKNGRSNASPNTYNGPGDIYFSSGQSRFEKALGQYGPIIWHSGLNSPNWTRHEIYKSNSTPGVADGGVWMAIGNKVVRNEKNIVTRATGESFKQTNIILGLMFANARNNGDHRIWIDDVYVDNTKARVELGNAPSFTSSTHREIQVPTYWSPNSINVNVNSGSFNSGEKVYLFVIDSNGNASTGYPVTIGTGSGVAVVAPVVDPIITPVVDPTPTPPANLHITLP